MTEERRKLTKAVAKALSRLEERRKNSSDPKLHEQINREESSLAMAAAGDKSHEEFANLLMDEVGNQGAEDPENKIKGCPFGKRTRIYMYSLWPMFGLLISLMAFQATVTWNLFQHSQEIEHRRRNEFDKIIRIEEQFTAMRDSFERLEKRLNKYANSNGDG